MNEAVLQERRGAVSWVTINRPEARNALNNPVVDGVAAALAAAEQDPEVLAVVLTGAGDRAFCAGGDLKPQGGSVGGPLQFDYSQPHTGYAELLRRANRFEKPIVARVNGAVMAGGMGVLSMCDMAVASDDVRLGLPEVAIGAFPMQVASVMQHLVPRRKFVEMCLTGEPITAQDALEMDLLNYVVPRAELDAKVEWLLARLLNKSPAAIRRGKNALRAIADMSFESSIAFTENQLATVLLMQDAVEGISAFNEKRKPRWTGR